MVNSLVVSGIAGARPVLGAVVTLGAHLLWSTLSHADTAALYRLVVAGALSRLVPQPASRGSSAPLLQVQPRDPCGTQKYMHL
jgi:hypothetical protein